MSFPAYNDLSSFQGPQANETEQFVSYLNGYLGTQHKDDGSHGNVTADSIHVVKGNPTTGTSTGTGNLTVDGTVTAAGAGASTFAGDVTADSPASPITLGATVGSLGGADGVVGTGVSVSTGGTPVRQWVWVLFDNGPVNHRGLRLLDVDGGFAPLEIQANNLGGNYWMAPGPVSSGSKTFDLGTTYYGFGQARWNNLYLAASVFEQNRTIAMGLWTAFTPTWTNLTVGNGTVTASYARVGKTSWVEVVLIWGSTTSIAGAVSITGLPTNNLANAGAQRLGHVTMLDSDTSGFYTGTALTGIATSATLYAQGAPLTQITATVPFTWAVNDQLHLWLNYQEP